MYTYNIFFFMNKNIHESTNAKKKSLAAQHKVQAMHATLTKKIGKSSTNYTCFIVFRMDLFELLFTLKVDKIKQWFFGTLTLQFSTKIPR